MRLASRWIVVILLILVLGVLSLMSLYRHPARPEPINVIPTPVYVGEQIMINQTRWSDDSRTLWFTGLDQETRNYAYDVPTGQRTTLDQSPFITHLTPEQQTQLEAFTDEAFVSPEGQYVIYKHIETYYEWSTSAHRMAIGRLSTGQHVLLDIGILDPAWIFWSANSQSALIFGMGQGLSGVYGITNFSADLMRVQAANLMSFQSGHHLYVDITSNGERALLRRWINVSSDTGLYVWDATQPHEPHQFMAQDSPMIFEGDRVVGAAFIADDSEMVMAVTDAGIVMLNMTTHQQSVINPMINASWVEWSYFSPDKQHIAVIPRVTNGFSCKLFVLPVAFSGDISAMLEQAPRCASYG